jgi:hypothetical protein
MKIKKTIQLFIIATILFSNSIFAQDDGAYLFEEFNGTTSQLKIIIGTTLDNESELTDLDVRIFDTKSKSSVLYKTIKPILDRNIKQCT